MNIINNNPYRILGVYANSSTREILANKGKAMVFLKVGKEIEYPLDLKGFLPPVPRSVDVLSEAESHVLLAKEKIQYAQFWFLKMTPLDDVAFNYLFAGKIDEAISIWSKQDNISSLQNKIVCYLIKNSISGAVSIAQQLYGKFGDTYIEKVDSSCTLKMTGVELRNLFIDSLGESVGIMNLLSAATDADWKSYISSQTIGPLINKISSEVEKTKKVDHKKAKARLEAGKKLIISTKEYINQLKVIIPVSDPQLEMISDKLGLEILQCGIDYLNNSYKDDDDAPRITLNILKEAHTIVVGSIAKQRCTDNIKTVTGIIENMPPKGTTEDVKKIENEIAICKKRNQGGFYNDSLSDDLDYITGRRWLAELESVEKLLSNTRQPLANIKAKTSANNDFYVNISTYVASTALSKIVDVVNNFQNDSLIRLMPVGYNYNKDNFIVSEYKNMLSKCWYAIKKIDDMDVSVKFANNFRKNRSTIHKMCRNAGLNAFDGVFGNGSYDEDGSASWWIGSIVVGFFGLIIGNVIGDGIGAIIGALAGFGLIWKIRESV